MVRVTKILFCGASGAGKTSLVYAIGSPANALPDLQNHLPTYEDTYTLYISAEKGTQEKVRIYEIGGTNPLIGRHFVTSCDALILVFDITSFDSFIAMQKIKAEIDSMKEKREIPTVVIGNKNDQPKSSEFETASPSAWAQKEKVAYFETNACDKATFLQILSGLVLKVNQPQSKTSFAFGKREGRCQRSRYLFDGHISACNFAQKRQCAVWLAHPQSQVIGLAVTPWKAVAREVCLISQGRDGKIRFWDTDLTLSQKPLLEVLCCQYTLCPFNAWQPGGGLHTEHYLVYVGVDEEDTSAVNLEAIRSLDSLTICSVDASQISRLGMCMALSGITCDGTCRFLGGFEAGCVVLFVEGRQVIRVSPLLPSDIRPITCLAVFTVDTSTALVAVGRSAVADGEEQLADFELLKLTSEGPSNFLLERCTKQPPSSEPHGTSSLTWRNDGRLLAAGQWNGDIRCFAVTHKGCARCLGNLRSPGAVVGGGTLLGDWSSISTDPSKLNPADRDQSLSIRGALFLPSRWLITTAPASAGGLGILNVWDVYRSS
ncbi:NF-kappa-B inhibitor-interacting Ras-like protein 2 [Taenia crassiceps]|uniref:NF-kappa-B inhibitor-interacting Ras-like protein 2 n=1 Tax=Taenia crassiceps TaxID=6207 RepID=A0ABR4QBX0_9CEST